MRYQEVRLQLDLRDLRPAGPRPDDRGFAPAPDQPVWRIKVDVREDAPVVSKGLRAGVHRVPLLQRRRRERPDRKSTRLNSSHLGISYAVFCLKKKKNKH